MASIVKARLALITRNASRLSHDVDILHQPPHRLILPGTTLRQYRTMLTTYFRSSEERSESGVVVVKCLDVNTNPTFIIVLAICAPGQRRFEPTYWLIANSILKSSKSCGRTVLALVSLAIIVSKYFSIMASLKRPVFIA